MLKLLAYLTFNSRPWSFRGYWPGEYVQDSSPVSQELTDTLQPMSLLCKASPLIDELALYDVVNTPGVAADLSHISSVAV